MMPKLLRHWVSASDVSLLIHSILLVSLLGSFLMTATAYADDEADTPQETPKTRREMIEFDDQLIQGDVQRPDLFYLLQRKQFNYKRLIKLRENFVPELKADSFQVGPTRGNP